MWLHSRIREKRMDKVNFVEVISQVANVNSKHKKYSSAFAVKANFAWYGPKPVEDLTQFDRITEVQNTMPNLVRTFMLYMPIEVYCEQNELTILNLDYFSLDFMKHVAELQCSHRFCSSCLLQLRSETNAKCPLCLTPITRRSVCYKDQFADKLGKFVNDVYQLIKDKYAYEGTTSIQPSVTFVI